MYTVRLRGPYVDEILTEVQRILRQVEDELTPIIAQGLTASITIHCGETQAIIEVHRKLTIKRRSQPKIPPQTWDGTR